MKFVKKRVDIEFVKKWAKKGFNPILLTILNRRGINTEEQLLEFIFTFFESIKSPFLFTQIIKAFERLKKALITKEKIIIFGDRDVDGTTSTAILFDYLKNLGFDVLWQVPVNEEPYGLFYESFKDWNKYNISLCITVDCGISNKQEVKQLRDMGIDTIIIDHHEPLMELPDAYAIINPKCEDFSDFKGLAGSGVTFLFIFGYLFFNSKFYNKKIGLLYKKNSNYQVDVFLNLIHIYSFVVKNVKEFDLSTFDKIFIYEKNDNEEFLKFIDLPLCEIVFNNRLLSNFDISIKAKLALFYKIYKEIEELEDIKRKYLPLVMLGTIADMMPLTGVNRILTKLGIFYFKEVPTENFIKLLDHLKIDLSTIDSKDISWIICPLLNSPGRMGDARKTVNFFLNNETDKIIKEMILINNDRKKKGEEAYQEFLKELEENMNYYENSLACFCSDEIDKGITGITAMRIAKYTNTPAIVVAKEGDYYSGSIRGNGRHDLVKFLEKGKNLFIQYGGHKNAAGFRFSCDKLEEFKLFLKKNISFLKEENNEKYISIDAEIPVSYLDLSLFKILNLLEPFGEGNEMPVFFTQGIKINSYVNVGSNGEHLKLYFCTKKGQIIGIFWNKAKWFEEIQKNSSYYNIIYKLEINKFNENFFPQLILLNMEF